MRLVTRLGAAGASLVMALALSAWPVATAASAAPAADAPLQLTITATEYAFDAPAQIEAGLVTLTYQNNGKESHNLKVWKLKDGKTLDDLKAAKTAEALYALVATAYGGFSSTPPGTTQRVVLDLPVGPLVLVSATRSTTDGVPDFVKGLLKPLTVVARTGGGAIAEPQADVAISLQDSGIVLPKSLGAGPHTAKITNDGTQLHQVILLRLQAGKTAADFATAFKANQTGTVVDPAGPNGGVAELSAGGHAWLTATFGAGDYVAFDDVGTSSFRDVPFPFTVSAQTAPSQPPIVGAGGAAVAQAPQTDAVAVVQQFFDARSRGDAAAALALFAADAVYDGVGLCTPTPCAGKAAIQPEIARLIAGSRPTVTSIQASAETVTVRYEVRGARVTAAGVERIVNIVTAEVKDGKITRFHVANDRSDPQTATFAAYYAGQADKVTPGQPASAGAGGGAVTAWPAWLLVSLLLVGLGGASLVAAKR